VTDRLTIAQQNRQPIAKLIKLRPKFRLRQRLYPRRATEPHTDLLLQISTPPADTSGIKRIEGTAVPLVEDHGRVEDPHEMPLGTTPGK
jgi:hypothetical protein